MSNLTKPKKMKGRVTQRRNRRELSLPWLQMAGESDEAFKAFNEYRKMPFEDRSIAALHKSPIIAALGINRIQGWFYDTAKSWAWTSRAEAYDNWQRYNRLTKQYARFLKRLEEQAAIGRKLLNKASEYLMGSEKVDVEEMWLFMQPRDLISALRTGSQIEREALKLERDAMIANEEFKDLDELSEILKPGSIQEQMFEAVMFGDMEALETLVKGVISSNERADGDEMPSQQTPLDEGQRERVRLMVKKLMSGMLRAPEELIADLKSEKPAEEPAANMN